MKPVHIGIDLGTTNSTAAAFDGEQLILVRNAQGGPLTPSVVRYDARGNALVGAKARRFLDSDPKNTRSEFKRLMGTAHLLDFPAAKLKRKPEELAAEVLRSMRADIREQLGFEPVTAVISVPALFELPQTRATAEAARLAGFDRVEMIQEPVASAIAAGWSAEGDEGKPWLVYDLGGGTFDVSLLETTEGLLRVVGHDGDNFLGGRDFDGAIVEWALRMLPGEDFGPLDPADPALAVPLRKLRHAAEEAKIELSRGREAAISLPDWYEGLDVDLLLDRDTLIRVSEPLVRRSIEVCERLLARHGLRPGGLGHVVLVGGPTVMPWLREAVASALGAPIKAGLDPMTLVAQGAALFAATSGLDARPGAAAGAAAPAASGPPVWVQFPSMTADSAPFVVGRVNAKDGVKAVRLRSLDGKWVSEAEPIDAEGAFALQAQLQARAANELWVEGEVGGKWLRLSGGAIRIVHGLTLQDPPLSRSIGVALAHDGVHVYVERGSPLPMRRAYTHHTVETIQPGDAVALSVPIVQGEFGKASLCRLVGTLEVPATGLKRALPLGSPIEVTLELDRGGRLAATARLEDGTTFEHVASLVVPSLDPAALTTHLTALRKRLDAAQRSAARSFDVDAAARLGKIEALLADADRGAAAARGGDPDALERSRRLLLEVDEHFAAQESAAAWPELENSARSRLAEAVIVVHRHGHPQEKEVLQDLSRRLNGALSARNVREVERISTQLKELWSNAYLRSPGAWGEQFTYASGRIGEMTDLRKANELVAQGQKAAKKKDEVELERVTRGLWALLPPSAKDRQKSFGSGLR